MTAPCGRLLAEADGAIGWVIFDNPARRNAVSLEMWQALGEAVERFERDLAIRVIALRGAGEAAFVSGADISQFEEKRASADAVKRYEAIAGKAVARLEATPKPTIAMIHGFCVGGGVGIALACDLRLAAETARFAIPAARLGLGYRWGGVKKLVDTVGPAFAKEIFYTARRFDAAEAFAMGLVNRVLPGAALEGEVRATCAMIAENAPLTLEAVKGVIRELGKPAEALDRALCDRLVARCFESRDYVEGRRAFMEKRKPVFTGE